MPIPMYDICIPALRRGLTNMAALLEKAAAHAESKKFEPSVLAQSRLFPDMLPLSAQVQIACDTAKGAAGRLAQVEIPKHADTEVTLAELKTRIHNTNEFLASIKAAQMEGADSRDVELKFPNGAMKFTGASYLKDFVLPNFYFHMSMVYALLRHNGVEIGKSDFLGALHSP